MDGGAASVPEKCPHVICVRHQRQDCDYLLRNVTPELFSKTLSMPHTCMSVLKSCVLGTRVTHYRGRMAGQEEWHTKTCTPTYKGEDGKM